MTKVRTYRIDVEESAQQWDAIVIGVDWWMTAQHLWSAASLNAGTNCWDVPVLDENWELPASTTPSSVMKKNVYDPNNKQADVYDYCNFDNTPTIPEVYDPTITFTQWWITKWSISLNQQWTATIALDAWWVSAWTAIDIDNDSIISVKYDDNTIKVSDNKIYVNVDNVLSNTSELPVQNKVIDEALWTLNTDISNLNDKFECYTPTSCLANVATSWQYCDLSWTPTIPTDNCQLANSCWYITNSVNDLVNYYLKCETYQKCEVDNLIANFGWFEVVSTLPTTNIKTNVIYLLWPIWTWTDRYEEWIYYNNTRTKIWETSTDLSNYAKCCDIPTDNCQLWNSCWYTTCTGTLVASDLNPYTKTCDLCNVALSWQYCDLSWQPVIPTDNCQLANGCWYTTCTWTLVASDLQPYATTASLCSVATSWQYCDLSGLPTIPAALSAWDAIDVSSNKINVLYDNSTIKKDANNKLYTDFTWYVQSCNLCSVATSWQYCDLTWQPTIPTDNCQLANSCGYTTCTGTVVASDLNAYAKNCDLATVATSWQYCDLSWTPTIPATLSSWTWICIDTNNKVNAKNTYIINEDAFNVTYTKTKWVAPYNTSYCYTNVDICADCWIKWEEGATYIFNLNTKVATSACRNVRLRIWDGEYIPLMGTTAAAAWSSYFVKSAIRQFQYSTKYEACWALHVFTDSNTTYSGMTTAEIDAGTGTTARLITPANLKYAIDKCIPTDNCQLANWCWYITSSALSWYAQSCDLCTVATSWQYCDLSWQPDLSWYQTTSNMVTNLTWADDNHYPSAKAVADALTCAGAGDMMKSVYDPNNCAKDAFNYCNFYNTPVIPTDNCQLWNGCWYITSSSLPTDNCQLANGCWYITSADVNTKTFTLSSTSDTTNATAALSHINWWGNAIIILNNISYNLVSKSSSSLVFKSSPTATANTSDTTINVPTLTFTISNSAVSSITSSNTSIGKYLETDRNYWTVYVPTYNGSPATKKYVDDCLACKANSSSLCTVATSGKYCDLTGLPTIPTNNNQLTNGCGYTTCTWTLTNSSLVTINGCCLVWSWDICIQGWVTSVNWCTWAVCVNEFSPASAWSCWQYLQKTDNWYDWAPVSSAWDMAYCDFNWVTKSWASFNLDFSSEITPTTNFTVNVPTSIKQWQTYILRVNSWAVPYTMTLWQWINNPTNMDLSLTPNWMDQFAFLAISDSQLDLLFQDFENVYLTQVAYNALPSTKNTDWKSYFIIQ